MKPEKMWAVFNFNVMLWDSICKTRQECKDWIVLNYDHDGLMHLGKNIFIRKVTVMEGWD